MSGSSGRTRVLRLIRFLLGLSAAAFVLLVARDLATKFEPGRLTIRPGYLLLSLVPAVVALVAQMFGWVALVERVSGRSVPRLAAAVLYLDSQMARYTPGKLGLVAVRVAGADSVGVTARVLASTLLIEVASWASVGLVVGFGLLFFVATLQPATLAGTLDPALFGLVRHASWVLALAALVGTTLLCTVGRKRWPGWLNRLLLGPLADEMAETSPLAPLRLPLWHLVHWLCWATAGVCLGWTVGVSSLDGLLIGAGLCVAIVAGFLAVVAPAGAGVREAVLTALATPSLGAAVGLSLGLLARAVALLAEVLVWLAARTLRVRRR